MLKTFGNFVKVVVEVDGSDYYRGSQGLLGRFPNVLRVGRDGVSVMEDVNKFEEPRLFKSYNEDWIVPANEKCIMPTNTVEKKMLHARRLVEGISEAAAEKVCAHLETAGDHKAYP